VLTLLFEGFRLFSFYPSTGIYLNLMKVVSSIGKLKKRSKECQVVRRRRRIYLICKGAPRFKARQGRARLTRK